MWHVTEMTDARREICKGTLAECARALWADQTAPSDWQDGDLCLRSYWIGDATVDCQVVKSGTTIFHVSGAVGDERRMHRTACLVSRALEAAGGEPLFGHPDGKPYIAFGP